MDIVNPIKPVFASFLCVIATPPTMSCLVKCCLRPRPGSVVIKCTLLLRRARERARERSGLHIHEPRAQVACLSRQGQLQIISLF
ncbi:hypothetical protein LX36DRAFT_664665, partial [Colletotrichum falcatum]